MSFSCSPASHIADEPADTLKIKKNGASVKKDYVVLENLFSNFRQFPILLPQLQHLTSLPAISSQYDLKGITSRFAKEPVGTRLDGDWINGAAQILIYSHSKALLRTAIARDVAFLSTSGLLDYSILVGVDGASFSVSRDSPRS